MYRIAVIFAFVFISCIEAGVLYPNLHNHHGKYQSSPLDLFAYDDLEHELHDLHHGLHEHDFLDHGLFKSLLHHHHHLHKRSAHYNYKPVGRDYNPDGHESGAIGINHFAPLNHHVPPVAVSHQSRVDIRGTPAVVATPVLPAKTLVQVPAPVVQVTKYITEPVYTHEPHVGHIHEAPVYYEPVEHAGLHHHYHY